MPEIGDPYVGRALAQRFAIKGRYAPGVEDMIVPVVVVEKLETALSLTAVRPVAAGASAPANSGNTSCIGIENPVGSGLLLRVLKGQCSCSVLSTLELRIGDIPGTLTSTQMIMADRRLGAQGASVIHFSNDSALSPGVVGMRLLSVAQRPVSFFGPWILQEGDQIYMRNGTSNANLIGGWYAEEISSPESIGTS